MKTIEYSIVIHKPVHEVFQYVEDLSKRPNWESGVVKAKVINGNNYEKGATLQVTSKIVGKKVVAEADVVEFEENQKTECVANKPFTHIITNIYEPLSNESTRLIRKGTADPDEVKKFFKFATPMVMKMMEKNLKETSETLKEQLEKKLVD
ncbi:SRPBCC family protein [Bacillus shivajii]|uniref:SRPBCC family protein n=1 Tax=Bacillus shivajii TaxID=1983719 RepID=UPI001CFA7C62|nr:SRPBCC family protein [Bacillus shivajii]UCZ54448.1 SRPBCC family protein [Bacillus shivajii]